MKNISTIFILLLLLWSCEDVVDVEVPTTEPKLVIDASIRYFPDSQDVLIENNIILTLTAPFFDNKVLPAEGATVFITDLTTNQVFKYREGEDGIYFPQSFNFIPEFDTPYQLTVIYNNETYTATTTMQSSVPIDDIRKGSETLFDGDEIEVIITITDDPEKENYYLFDLDMNLYLPSEDRFFQGKTFPFSYFYEKVEDNQELDIRLLGIDKAYFNYMTLLLEQSGQNSGGPFQAPPATLRGNIINTSNADNIALGYFSISETFNKKFTLPNE